MESEISNRKALESEALQEKYFVSKAKRAELYGEELSRLKEKGTFDDTLASFDEVIVELNRLIKLRGKMFKIKKKMIKQSNSCATKGIRVFRFYL